MVPESGRFQLRMGIFPLVWFYSMKVRQPFWANRRSNSKLDKDLDNLK